MISEQVYLPGPTVCGFYGMFEADHGDPNTPLPLARVTPSRVSSAILPFHCPSCDAVVDFSDPERREHYHDTRVVNGKRRDNYWCPRCQVRFLLNPVGQAFTGTLGSDGAAPSTVEKITVGADGLVSLERRRKRTVSGWFSDYVMGCDVLGCC